jgi:hypothetical protein
MTTLIFAITFNYNLIRYQMLHLLYEADNVYAF